MMMHGHTQIKFDYFYSLVTFKTVKPKEGPGFPVTEPSRQGKEGLCQGIPLYIKKT
jgi:hypothetical protein